jgi:CrcB protein
LAQRRRSAGELAELYGVVAVGGAFGASARYSIAQHWHAGAGAFPWPTFAINVSGAFLLGLLVGVLAARFPGNRFARPLLGIGLLGAYTTMSTLAVDVDLLTKDGHVVVAGLYLVLSAGAGVAAAAGGLALGRRR